MYSCLTTLPVLQTVCRLAGLEREAFLLPFLSGGFRFKLWLHFNQVQAGWAQKFFPSCADFCEASCFCQLLVALSPAHLCLWAWVLRSVLEKTPLKLPYKLETLKRESSRPRAWSTLVPLELQAVPLEQRRA